MIDVLGALMGIDMQGFARPEGSDEVPEGVSTSDPFSSTSTFTPAQPPPAPAPSKSTPTPAQEDVEMEADDEEAAQKKQGEAAKKAGSEAYKKRDFAEAAKQFSAAWDVYPKDVTYLTNLGAVYFEQGDYDKAIETCLKAVDEAREVRA